MEVAREGVAKEGRERRRKEEKEGGRDDGRVSGIVRRGMDGENEGGKDEGMDGE